MNVCIFQEQSDLPLSNVSVEALLLDFNKFMNIFYNEVSVHFIDEQRISELHADFFQDRTATDCLSFPMDDANEEGYRMMGDVFVCPKTAKEYVAEHGGDIYKETTLYVVHGLLHLIGYRDLQKEDEKRMRTAEAAYLSHVEEKQLWLRAL